MKITLPAWASPVPGPAIMKKFGKPFTRNTVEGTGFAVPRIREISTPSRPITSIGQSTSEARNPVASTMTSTSAALGGADRMPVDAGDLIVDERHVLAPQAA